MDLLEDLPPPNRNPYNYMMIYELYIYNMMIYNHMISNYSHPQMQILNFDILESIDADAINSHIIYSGKLIFFQLLQFRCC